MIKYGYFTREGRVSGTSYHQAYIYRDAIKEHGVSFEYYPILPDGLWKIWKRALRAKGYGFAVLRRLFRMVIIPAWRLCQLLVVVMRGNHGLIIGGCLAEAHSYPWLERVFAWACRMTRKPLVLYLADAMHEVFPAQYEVRYQVVDHIICVTPWLEAQLRGRDFACSLARVAIDIRRYPLVTRPRRDEVIIGFSGGPNNFKGLLAIEDSISDVLAGCPSARFIVVSGGPPLFNEPGLRFEFRKWLSDDPYRGRFELGAEEMLDFDIALAPLIDCDYSRGKDSAKLRQYMALGLAIVGSNVGVNSEILRHGDNGFLARTHEEWCSCLRQLIGNPELRRRLGLKARADVERHFDVRVQARILADALHKVVKHCR